MKIGMDKCSKKNTFNYFNMDNKKSLRKSSCRGQL